jgi:CheY-like chemotaxis protein
MTGGALDEAEEEDDSEDPYDEDDLTPIQFTAQEEPSEITTQQGAARRPEPVTLMDPPASAADSAVPPVGAPQPGGAPASRRATPMPVRAKPAPEPIGTVPSHEVEHVDQTTPGSSFDDVTVPLPEGGMQSTAPMSDRELLARWMAEMGKTPLLLIIPNNEARLALQQAAEKLGFSVLCVDNGKAGYSSAIRVRPVAILSDLRVRDMEGRELLGAIRTDFMVRETPFLMISGDDLSERLAGGAGEAMAPILKGLETALKPRSQLYAALKDGAGGELAGRLDAVGIGMLLKSVGAAKLSGQLLLHKGEQQSAEVAFSRGEICGATITAPGTAVGPLAMLHILGYEWQDFRFVPADMLTEHQVPLGALARLVESASQQNNALLTRIYQQGMGIDDISVDRAALDSYLQTISPDSLEVLIRLVEGESATSLVAQRIAAPGLLRSMLFDLRRKAVIRIASLRPVRMETPLEVPLPPLPTEASEVKQRRRWLVVVVAGFTTVLLAAGGYLVYWHFSAG